MVQIVRRARRRVWSKYSKAQRISSLHLAKGPLESTIAVGYVFQFSGRSSDGVVSKNTNELKIRHFKKLCKQAIVTENANGVKI